jgi:hypothetical protein
MLTTNLALPTAFQFNVNNTQTISGEFSTLQGKTISIDWGDGSGRSTYSGIDQAWSKDYGSAGNRIVKIYNAIVLTRYLMNEAFSGISFDLANLPSGLTSFYCSGFNTISGDLANLPSGLTSFYCSGFNTISGDLANLPSGLTYFNCRDSNTISGDLANLPSGLTYFNCRGSNTISNYTTPHTWLTKPTYFTLIPVGVGGLSTAEIDNLLIDFYADLVFTAGNTITLTGTNAARSATSDAAVANMVSEGATVTTN